MDTTASPQDIACGRCAGNGIIEVYRHVVGGVCFRCWGCGVDPRTAEQLKSWLERARREYRVRRATLKTATDRKPIIERELKLLTRMGVHNRKRLDALMAWMAAGKETAGMKT